MSTVQFLESELTPAFEDISVSSDDGNVDGKDDGIDDGTDDGMNDGSMDGISDLPVVLDGEIVEALPPRQRCSLVSDRKTHTSVRTSHEDVPQSMSLLSGFS